jgi:hypothetical protein
VLEEVQDARWLHLRRAGNRTPDATSEEGRSTMTDSTRPDDAREEVPEELRDRLDELGGHLVEDAPAREDDSRDSEQPEAGERR